MPGLLALAVSAAIGWLVGGWLVGGWLVGRSPGVWYAGLIVGALLWFVLTRFTWRRDRRIALAAHRDAVSALTARKRTSALVVDPGLSQFVAVDDRHELLTAGGLDGAPVVTWRTADIADAEVEIDRAWGLLLDGERTAPGRIASTLYFPLQPLMAIVAILSIFDPPAGGIDDPFIAHRRVRRIRVVATARNGSVFDVAVFDDTRSALYPGASAAREREAREVVAMIRRVARLAAEADAGRVGLAKG